ncbi:MAG: glycoside hydrolase family 95 protein, partial [Devosia sp.]
MTPDLELWYRRPASEWTEALPVGNGRLGAMIFGGVPVERLQLNEDTLWTGGPYSPVNPDAPEYLDEVRAQIFAGRYAEAEAIANRHLMARPLKQMAFQPAGDLWIEFAHESVEGYRRSLDLDRAVQTTTYQHAGTTFRREVFASHPDGVLVVRLSADRPGQIDCRLSLTSEQPGEAAVSDVGALAWRGQNRPAEGIEGRLRFEMRADIRTTGGRSRAEGSGIVIEKADEVLILIDIATSYRRFDDVSGDPAALIAGRLGAAARKSFDELLQSHIADHQRLFQRLSIDLGNTGNSSLPTDERIRANPAHPDPGLAALYVQYGRYLMIASSRPGTQPANLQGLWNDQLEPPWGSKYTTNINLEMNYWLADPGNLAECMEPVVRLVEDLAVTGADIASKHYGADGWVLHHNTDLWRAAAPVDGAQWGLWPTGGAWICAQLWDHLSFSWNEDLARRLYPVMAGATRFFLDVLKPLPGTDRLVTVPSVSPENVHPHGASLCAGPTMDNQILRDLFDATVTAAERLGVDAEFRRAVAEARKKLPPDRIGRDGQLQEWLEDWDAAVPEIHHRHVSHLYGLYPSQQIDPLRTPELAAAARRSLEIRG